MKHTPGPWNISGGQIVAGAQEICTIERTIIANGSPRANARLLAAAPDLLEAALELLGNLYDAGEGTDEETGEDFADVAALQAAVDKAIG